MMKLVISFYEMGLDAIENKADIEKIVKLSVREKIGRFKYVEESKIDEEYEEIIKLLEQELEEVTKGE